MHSPRQNTDPQGPIDRRAFNTVLGSSAASLLVGAMPDYTDAAKPSNRKPSKPRPGEPDGLRFGLVTYLWGKDMDLKTLIRTCEASGTGGVELRTTHKHGVEVTLSKAQRAEVRKRFADSGVTLLGPGSNERFDNPDPKVVRKAIEATKAFVQLSHDTGGTGVKVKPDRFHNKVPRKKTIEQIGRSLNELGRFAADLGQEIRLEVHGQCAELPTIASIMEIASHPAVAVCWNSNAQDLQGKGIEHNFGLVRDRFGATAHVRELDGDYPYSKLFDLMVTSNYRGWVLLEGRKIPKNKVEGLKQQKAMFDRLVANAKEKTKR